MFSHATNFPLHFHRFMEPEVSLICFHDPYNDLYLEPDESNPSAPCSSKTSFNIILSVYRFSFRTFSFWISPLILYPFLFSLMRVTCTVYLFLFELIILIIFGEEYNKASSFFFCSTTVLLGLRLFSSLLN
jgi:hypothetical protein